MIQLTDSQLIHRQYLQSPVWQEKRRQALVHYGPVCNRCGEPGSDVHHKTYDRVGGQELMEDLEVLCRGCHEAHHRAERCARTRKTGRRAVNRQALFRTLSPRQRASICRTHGINESQLYIRLGHGSHGRLCNDACRMLGVDGFYSVRPGSNGSSVKRRRVIHLV